MRCNFRPIRSSSSTQAKRQGFTLVELMGVIVILGMLAGVMTVGIRRYMVKSRQNVARVEVASLQQAVESFYAETGRYPNNEEGLEVLLASEDEPDGYLDGKAIGKDPWGKIYDYISPAEESPYLIICYGADGREGGAGEDKDVLSTELGDQ